jgi:phospholipase C
VREPNITKWRRKTFGDFTSVFRFGQPPAPPPILPDTSSALHLARYAATHLPPPTIPATDQKVPNQS